MSPKVSQVSVVKRVIAISYLDYAFFGIHVAVGYDIRVKRLDSPLRMIDVFTA